jgi:hypothetical protein
LASAQGSFIGLALCYFGIYAPIQQMSQGEPDITVGRTMPILGPFFAIGGLGLVLATLVSRWRGADFSVNLFQRNGLHRSIVVIGMLTGIVVGLYFGIFVMQHMQAEFGYVPS